MQDDYTLNIKAKDDGASGVVKDFNNNIVDSGKKASDFGDKLNKAALAIGAAGIGLTAYSKMATNSTIDYTKNINNIARITGDTVEKTSALQYVFQRSGIAADQTASVFGIFSKQINATNDAMKDGAAKTADLNNKIDAAKIKIADLTAQQAKNGDSTGTLKNQIEGLNIAISGYQKQMTDAQTPLQKLGVNTQDADGKTRSFNDILLDVADKFKSLPNGAEKTATSMQLFGRSGKDLIPILNKGSDGIQQLEQQAEKLGLTLNSSNVNAVLKYTDSQKKLKDAQQQFTLAIGNEALPMWQRLTDAQLRAVQIYQQMPEPIRAAVAAVVSFGGPVLTAASGVAGFAGNIGSALPLIADMAGKLGGLSLFLTGPWAIAFAGAALAVGVVAGQFLNQTGNAQALTTAQNNLKTATDSVATSQRDLSAAQLAQEGASLGVQLAQRSYNDAVNQFGPNSLEAQNALYNLKVAQQNYTDAQQRTKDKAQELKDKEAEVAKDTQLVKHLKEIQDNLQGVNDKAFAAGSQIQRLNGSKVTVKTTKNAGGQEVIDFVSTFGRAKGGSVQAGQPYVVGENSDGSLNNTSELFVPGQSGQIINAKNTQKLLGGAGGGMTNNFYGNFSFSSDALIQSFFNRLDETQRLASTGAPV